MNIKMTGLRRYMHEYQIYRDLQEIQKSSGATITVSAARAVRANVETALRSRGLSMADAALSQADSQAAMHEAFKDISGYDGAYADESARGNTNANFLRTFDEFASMVKTPENDPRVQGRLPISPYDPRWASRSSVKAAGSSLLYLSDDEVAMALGDASKDPSASVAPLTGRHSGMKLHRLTDDGRLAPAGLAYSKDDASGMTELMGYMSRSEYLSVRDWVINQPASSYMSEEGLSRATAILDELNEQGTAVRVSRDRRPGQLVAHVAGTKLSVRLTDAREQEQYVGRVYDDGISTYFTTNHTNGTQVVGYTPTNEEAVALLRTAQGLPVSRIDGKGLVGVAGEAGDAYFANKGGAKTSSFVFGDYLIDGNVVPRRDGTTAKVMIHRVSDRSVTTTWFGADEERFVRGRDFVADAVASSRSHVQRELDVDTLVAEFEEHREAAQAGEYFPEFSGDEALAPIQRGYWDVLRGAQTTLLLPGASVTDYQDAVGVLAEIDSNGETLDNLHDMLVRGSAYTGTPVERVRAHATDVLDGVVGTEVPRLVDLPNGTQRLATFDPAAVSKYMVSEYGVWRNCADLTEAMRAGQFGAEGLAMLQGDNSVVRRVRDDMLEFDTTTARTLADLDEGSFLHTMVGTVGEALQRNGIEVSSLSIDDNGIIDWRGIRRDGAGKQLKGYFNKPEELHGQLGQVFEPGDHDEITTQFNSGENYMFVPGYEARVVTQKAGEDLSLEQRTRLRGYQQIMGDQIAYQVAGDSLTGRTETGGPTVLNGVYRRLYDERHETDFLGRAEERGLGRGWAEAVLATEGRRVRYPDNFSDTLYESWFVDSGQGTIDRANDTFGSPLVLTGGRNIAVMDERSDGYFDPDLTNAARPGVTRFLVESASVGDDGRIVAGDKDDRTPVMKHADLASIGFDPYDRRQMTGRNLMHASGVTRPRRTALMTFGGWGADDGIVVSTEFATEHRILGKDGLMRDLVVGDKVSDLHGNKGVISLVVDRENDYGKALSERDQNMMYAAGVFRDNPELDVVMSPFSAVGRFNGGTARELMQSPGDLVLPFKGIQPALTGEMRFIVTHKDVKTGTRVYDDEALTQGGGRKASAQLAWALDSQGATEVMGEFYGPNGNAVANFREVLISVGLDMTPDGTLITNTSANENKVRDERRVFSMPELVLKERGGLDPTVMRQAFAQQIGTRGGDMEIPFPLTFPEHGEGMSKREVAKATVDGKDVWHMPVLSSQLRTGQMLDDGTNSAHEYTTQYLKIFTAACDYRYQERRLAGDFGEVDAAMAIKARRTMEQSQRMAQSAFSVVTSGLIDRQLSGNHNMIKESLMSSRLPSSATAVWSADPRLDIDQVAMSPDMAQALGVEADGYVLVWRDPVLRDAGVRYMRVSLDERLTGVAINPVMDKSFDGDFDGDSVAIVKLHGERAHNEAMNKLTVEANLLDLGAIEAVPMPDGSTEELHPLMMQDSLDVKVSQSIRGSLTERFGELTMRANEVHSDFEEGTYTQDQRLAANRLIKDYLSAYYREAMEGQYGDAALSFADPVSHLESVKHACIDTGAKGSPAKLAAYAKHLGVDENGVDQAKPLHTREEDQGVMVAIAVKTAVGIAGAFSQRGVKALRNEAQKSVLELTYPVTQSLLQSKHDPHEAMQKYGLLLSSARDLWKGRRMERVTGPDGISSHWSVATDDRGNDLQASTAQWEEQFMAMYTSKDGLNIPSVDPEHVSIVASALSDGNGIMRDIETVGAGSDLSATVEGLANGSTMDRLAYGGTFEDLCAAATQNENLFAAEHNRLFAPFEIQRNLREADQYEMRVERAADPTRPVPAPEYVPIVNRDILRDDNELARARGVNRRSALATTVRAPAPAVTVAEPVLAETESDGFEHEL